METLNDITYFISGLAFGIIIGHYIWTKVEAKLHYSRGRIDGINELWPSLIDAWKQVIRLQHLIDTRAKTNGSSDSNEKTV